MSAKPHKEEPFFAHLGALRSSLIKALLAFMAVSSVTVFFSKPLYTILTKPLSKKLPMGSYFISTHPLEAWMTYLKVGFLTGLIAASPLLFYIIWKFVSPGLLHKEKKYTMSFVFFSSLFFISGVVFAYYFALPLGFDYFVGVLQGTDIHFMPQMDDSLSFISSMLIAFGVIFEIPLLIFFLAVTGIVSINSLVKFQKYMVVIMLIIAAILTPPDVVTQLMMGIPMILLYEVGLLAAWIFVQKKS